MALTPNEFSDACTIFAQKYSANSIAYLQPESQRNGCTGWTWVPHPTWPAFGYLTRTTSARHLNDITVHHSALVSSADEELEDATDAIVPPNPSLDNIVSVLQYIVYSPSFQVPAFYFIVSRLDGTPLSLDQVVKTSFFRRGVLPDLNVQRTHIEHPASGSHSSVFPLLSQGDHPVLQTMCWYFHPCETQAAVQELLAARQVERENTTLGGEEFLETWLMVLGNIVNLED